MKVPDEMEVWEIELVVTPIQETDEHEIPATWMGWFATRELAEDAAEEAFGDFRNSVFDWRASPSVIQIQGGDPTVGLECTCDIDPDECEIHS